MPTLLSYRVITGGFVYLDCRRATVVSAVAAYGIGSSELRVLGVARGDSGHR